MSKQQSVEVCSSSRREIKQIQKCRFQRYWPEVNQRACLSLSKSWWCWFSISAHDVDFAGLGKERPGGDGCHGNVSVGSGSGFLKSLKLARRTSTY